MTATNEITETIAIVRPARFEVHPDNRIEHADFGEPDIASDAMEALDYAQQQVYLAARRYVAAFEKYEITVDWPEDGPTLGTVGHDLAHEVGHYHEVYDLLDSIGYWNPSKDEPEPEEADQITLKL